MPENSKNNFYLAIVAVVVIVFVILFIRQKIYPMPGEKLYPAKIGAVEVKVEIADTDKLKTQGLSYRLDLPANQGMLFSYLDQEIRTFHMNGMFFPLDIIWLQSGQIVAIDAKVPLFIGEDQQITRVTSQMPVDGVLEVNAGFTAKHGINIGDKLKLLAR